MVAESDLSGLWAEYTRTRSVELRNRLVAVFLPLLKKLSMRMHARLAGHVDLGDLISWGSIGLMAAVEKFDPSRGVRFGAYAGKRIHGAMLDGIRDLDRVPRYERRLLQRSQEAIDQMRGQLGREPQDDEISERMGISPRELEALRGRKAAARPLLSLGRIGRDESSLLHVMEEAIGAIPIDEADEIRHLLRGLNRKERLLMVLYHVEGMTMKEVGKSLGVGESRVSQMHKNILQLLRATLRDAAAN